MNELHLAELTLIKALQSIRSAWIDQIFLTLNIFDSDLTYMIIVIVVRNFKSEKSAFHLLYLLTFGGILHKTLKAFLLSLDHMM